MYINTQVIACTESFNTIAKSVLLGHSRNAPSKVFEAVPMVTVAVFGTTEASAEAFVKSAVTGRIPSTIVCFGADSDFDAKKISHFSGTALMLPELAYVSDQFMDTLVQHLEQLTERTMNNVGMRLDKVGTFKELHVIFAKQETENAILGAKFERFKNSLEYRNGFNISIDAEHTQYIRKYRVGGACSGVCEPVIIHYLDISKVMGKLVYNTDKKNHFFVQAGLETVYFGEQFAKLDPETIEWLLMQFNHSSTTTSKPEITERRKIILHDLVAARLFKGTIDRFRYFHTTHGVAYNSDDDCDEKVSSSKPIYLTAPQLSDMTK